MSQSSKYPRVNSLNDIYSLPEFKETLLNKVKKRLSTNDEKVQILKESYLEGSNNIRSLVFKCSDPSDPSNPSDLERIDDLFDFVRGDFDSNSFWYEGINWLIGDGDDYGALEIEDGFARIWVRHFSCIDEVNLTRGSFRDDFSVYENNQYLNESLISEINYSVQCPMTRLDNTNIEVISETDSVQIIIDFDCVQFGNNNESLGRSPKSERFYDLLEERFTNDKFTISGIEFDTEFDDKIILTRYKNIQNIQK